MGGPLLLKKINILERVSNAKATMTFKNNPSRNKNMQAVAQIIKQLYYVSVIIIYC